MLQRIQTVWIVLAILGALFLFMTAQDAVVSEQFPVITIGCAALVLLGALSIFSYQNRPRQILLNNISIGINALLLGFLAYWLLKLSGGIEFPEKGIEPIFPVLSMICLMLANRFIARDSRLVKSVDRLR